MKKVHHILGVLLMVAPLLAVKPFGPEDPYREFRNRTHNLPLKGLWMDLGARTPKGQWLTRAQLDAGPYPGPITQAALEYLRDEGEAYGVTPSVLQDLKVRKVLTTSSTDHVRFQQTYHGIPVFSGELVVSRRLSDQRITFVSSRIYPIHSVPLTPQISADEAYQLALQNFPIQHILAQLPPELMIYPQGNGRLVWRVQIPSDNPVGDWEFFIDALSGELVFLRDQSKYVDGQGLVFYPDPLTTSHHYYNDSPEWADNGDQDNDSLNSQRFLVTLRDLTDTGSGYSLDGPFVNLQDIESPPDVFPVLPDPNGFQYTRSQQEFEDVMVYFHIDNVQRYFQDSLGIFFANNESQDCDPHGLNGADNSHYSPSLDYIAWGEGGVDDDEDADVILHEYGHAIQDDIVPGWGVTHEAAAMGEGFGDYLAVTYAIAVDTFRWADVFTWDGHNPFWPGRSANMDSYHYPEDAAREIHDAGQLWSSALMDVYWALVQQMGLTIPQARKVIDALVITHHTYLTATATMPEAANAIIQTDIDLYGGSHLGVILPIFDARGFIDLSAYVPQIVHDPLHDTEDLIGPYPVVAQVIPAIAPIDSVMVYYWTSLTPSDTTALWMTPIGADSFEAQIPGPGAEADVFYYIYAVDTSGAWATDPSGAPNTVYQFHVGPDTEPPTITHTPIPQEFSQTRWPATVQATVTDNLGVDSVWVNWMYNGTPQPPLTLQPQGDDLYAADFPLPTVNIGDSIAYQISAVDLSSNANLTVWPSPGDFYTFHIVQTLGVVLVINDDTGDRSDLDKGGAGIRTFETGETADSIASWLTQIGYDVTLEEAATTDPSTWPSYDFIVWSSGEDVTTVGQQTASGGPPYADQRRQDLLNFLNNNGKVFFEGGELGWDAQAGSSGDPLFAAQALHITDWSTDNPMDLHLIHPTHPIATTPNALPTLILRNDTGTGWGDGDALTITPDATLVFETTAYPGEAGILASNDGKTVFTAFNFLTLADWNQAKDLLENIAEYLMQSVEASENTQILNRPFQVFVVPQGLSIRYTRSSTEPIEVLIYDLTGRRIWQTRVTPRLRSGETLLRLHIPLGVYFYKIVQGSQSQRGKFVWLY